MGIWLEVDSVQCFRGERDGLEVVVAASGIAEFRSAAAGGVGGPGAGAGEVEELAVCAVVEYACQAVNLGGGGDLLAQFPGQGRFVALAVLDAAAGQDPVRLLSGADPADREQVTVRGDQQCADAEVMVLLRVAAMTVADARLGWRVSIAGRVRGGWDGGAPAGEVPGGMQLLYGCGGGWGGSLGSAGHRSLLPVSAALGKGLATIMKRERDGRVPGAVQAAGPAAGSDSG